MAYTTLILGAGVSKAYGYPTGQELVEKIVEKLAMSEVGQDQELFEALLLRKPYSIDMFIHRNKNFKMRMLELIAETIIDYENEELLLNPDTKDDFYRLLFDSIDDFSRIKIISFNYDRSLEWRFYLFVRNKFKGSSAEDILQEYKKLEIVHMHGRLPPFSFEEPKVRPTVFEKTYGKWCATKDELMSRGGYSSDGSQIRAYHEELKRWAREKFNVIYDNQQTSDDARDIIGGSHRIFFLGFSYNSLNIQKLGFNFTEKTIDYSIGGTTLYLPGVQYRELKRLYPGIEHLYACSVVDFFMEHFDLRNSDNDVFQAHGARRYFPRRKQRTFVPEET